MEGDGVSTQKDARVLETDGGSDVIHNDILSLQWGMGMWLSGGSPA